MSSPLPLSYDIIVVGAGVAGSAAAFSLSKAGRSVLLIEKSFSEPNLLKGELLQPLGVKVLKQLGLSAYFESINTKSINGYVIHNLDDAVNIPFPNLDVEAEGRSLCYGAFVTCLRKACAEQENITMINGLAVGFITCPLTNRTIGIKVNPSNGRQKSFFANLIICSDGCFSKLRPKLPCQPKPSTRSYFVGFLMRNNLSLPYRNYGQVVLTNKSPVLLYEIPAIDKSNSTNVRVLVDIKASEFLDLKSTSMRNYILENISPFMPKEIQSDFEEAVLYEKFQVMPSFYLPFTGPVVSFPGVVLLGDSMNIRHPIAGNGMSVLLSDVLSLGQILKDKDLADFIVIDDALTKFARARSFSLTFVLNSLAELLYAILSADINSPLNYFKVSFFNYFKRGGICVSQPAGIISGIKPSIILLCYHFVIVTILSIKSIFSGFNLGNPGDCLNRILLVLLLSRDVALLVFPLLWAEILLTCSVLNS